MNYSDIKIGELYRVKSKKNPDVIVALYNIWPLEQGTPLNELEEEHFLGELSIPNDSLILCIGKGTWTYERKMKPERGFYFLYGINKFFFGEGDCDTFVLETE